MNLFFFFIKLKYKAYLNFSNWKNWLIDFAAVLFASIIGSSVGILYDALLVKKSPTANLLLPMVNGCLYMTPIFLRFFIAGFSKKFLLSPHYPIAKKSIVVLDIILYGFCRTINFALTAFLIGLYIKSHYFKQTEMLFSFLFLVVGILFTENLTNAISFGKYKYLIINVLVIILFSFTNHWVYLINALPLILITNIGLMLFLYWQQYEPVSNSLTGKFSYSLILPNIHLKMAFGNSLYKKSLATSMAFKISVWLYVLYLSKFKYTHTDEILIFNKAILIASMPIILFTYIYNNIWGYFKALALNLLINGGNYKVFLYQYCKLLWPILLIDFLVSVILLITFGVLSIPFFLYYLFYTAYAIALGTFGSFLMYFEIKKSLSFTSVRGNASLLINLLSLACLIPFSFLNDVEFRSYRLLLIPLIIAIIINILYKKIGYFFIDKLKMKVVKSV